MNRMKLLIQMLYDASTNKYPKYFPHPMLLLKYGQNCGDEYVILDLNLLAYNEKANSERKLEIMSSIIGKINARAYYNYQEIIVNMGEFPPDADKNKYFDMFIKNVTADVSIMGMYPTIEKSKIDSMTVFSDNIKILETDFDVHDVLLSEEMINSYPLVEGKRKRASMKLTYGCPRSCNMCPTHLVYNKKYKYFDIDTSIETIKHYYSIGVRYITFTDDNISASKGKFIEFLEKLSDLNLKGMKYICQEGFEVTAFKDERIAELLVKCNFEDIKIGFENINEEFLKSINKYYSSSDDIAACITNLKKYNIQPYFLFLIGSTLTEEQILENLKYIADNKMFARVNVIRKYEKNKCKNELSEDILYSYKALANAMNFFTEKDINLFSDSAFECMLNKLSLEYKESEGCYIIEGKMYFGFERTNKFMKGLKYLVEKKHHKNKKIEYVEMTKNKISYRIM